MFAKLIISCPVAARVDFRTWDRRNKSDIRCKDRLTCPPPWEIVRLILQTPFMAPSVCLHPPGPQPTAHSRARSPLPGDLIAGTDVKNDGFQTLRVPESSLLPAELGRHSTVVPPGGRGGREKPYRCFICVVQCWVFFNSVKLQNLRNEDGGT